MSKKKPKSIKLTYLESEEFMEPHKSVDIDKTDPFRFNLDWHISSGQIFNRFYGDEKGNVYVVERMVPKDKNSKSVDMLFAESVFEPTIKDGKTFYKIKDPEIHEKLPLEIEGVIIKKIGRGIVVEDKEEMFRYKLVEEYSLKLKEK